MNTCLICGSEHARMWGDMPAMYCKKCAKVRGDAEGTLTHVLGNLYLGDYEAAKVFDGKRICVYCDAPLYEGFFIHIPILATRPKSQLDRTATASLPQLDAASDLITEILEKGEKLLVHCMGGVERSPLTIAYWLVKTGKYQTLSEAYAFLKGIRPVVANRQSWLP